MDEKELSSPVLRTVLEEIQQGRSKVSRAQESNSAAIALCELVQPTLVKKSQGEDFFRLSPSELRSELDDRDLIIYQAAQVIALLSDKAMDLDSWLGSIGGTFKKSVDYLTLGKDESGVANHE